MSQIKTRGSINFYEGGEDIGNTNPPVISNFQSNISGNDVTISFAVSNYTNIRLTIQFINDDGSVASSADSIDLTAGISKRYTFSKNLEYKTRVYIEASNSIASVDYTSEKYDKAVEPPKQIEELINSLSIIKTNNSFDKIDIALSLNKIDNVSYDPSKIKISLLSKRQDFKAWKIQALIAEAKQIFSNDINKIVIGYDFSFLGLRFTRTSIGGFFNFQIKVSIEGYADSYTEIKTIFFDDLPPVVNDTDASSTFPNAEIQDKFASLRYEIEARFTQVYVSMLNVDDPNSVKSKTQQIFTTRFLDSENIPEIGYYDFLLKDGSGGFSFYYEFNNNKTDGSTKGYMYPASVSEIYPCIIPLKDNQNIQQNHSIVFFWKISPDFFDYYYFRKQISVYTNTLKVKLQFKNSSGVYEDLTEEISLEKAKHFQSSTGKFIISIKRDSDIITGKENLFNQILESDNSTDKVRFLITEHSVSCSSLYGGAKEFTFDKLLIPPKWTYMTYDKYLPKNPINRNANKIKIDLAEFSLRGIRIPDIGFKKLDKIRNFYQDGVSFDLALSYKLSLDFIGLYKDPIVEGTINSIVVPEIPDDVFLIPPKIIVPPPNMKSVSQGGTQGEARVNLNEYGKIKAIEMTNPGAGYSLYKNALDKRKQTFTDFVPLVITSYKSVSSQLPNNKASLVPKNLSFDSSNLKASMVGGIRLKSVLADYSFAEDQLTDAQKKDLSDYLPSNVEDIIGSDPGEVNPIPDAYDVNSDQVQEFQSYFDNDWADISSLYEEKYHNPANKVSIYNEDNDIAVADGSDSASKASITSSQEAPDLTPVSATVDGAQTSQDGGAWQAFGLNNLSVIPDGSAAVSVSTAEISPPWLTLMPISVRDDAERGFGPLPNMFIRAEMFNRIVSAINNLNEVRVIAPFIWLVDYTYKTNAWAKPALASSSSTISFDTGGTKIESSETNSSLYIPINGGVSVSASRDVAKGLKKSSDVAQFGLTGGIYAISSEFSSSVSFKPAMHPLMNGAIKDYLRKSIKRRFLGIVTRTSSNCGGIQLPISSISGVPVIVCNTRNGNSFEKNLGLSSVPNTTYDQETELRFFDSGGSITKSPRGTAKYVGVQIESVGGNPIFCGAGCSDSDVESVDFAFTNMFPATYKLD